jgi:YD repeat-containing protein
MPREIDAARAVATAETDEHGELQIPDAAIAMDYAAGLNPIYIGRARTGAGKAEPIWQIRRMTYDGSGNLTDQQWADGDNKYDNIWNSRAILSYS